MTRILNLAAAAALLIGAVQACKPGEYRCVYGHSKPPAIAVCESTGHDFAIIAVCKGGDCWYDQGGTPHCGGNKKHY